MEWVVADKDLIAENEDIPSVMLVQVDGFTADVVQGSGGASSGATQIASASRIILLIIRISGLVGTLGVAGYFATRWSG